MTLYERLKQHMTIILPPAAQELPPNVKTWLRELCHLIEADKAGLAQYGTSSDVQPAEGVNKEWESKLEKAKKAIHDVFRDTSITPRMSYNRAQLIIAHVHEYVDALLVCFPELDDD